MDQTECATPGCSEDRIDGRRFCQPHADNLDRIKSEFENDPKLLYNMRSDMRKGDGAAKMTKRPPTCCFMGCYEIREAGKSFCFAHESEEPEAA